MSAHAMTHVLRDLPANHADAVVLLVLASHADADKWQCWPSVSTIGQTARMDRRSVQRVLRRLERSGRLRVVLHGWGDGPWITRPNLYQITREGVAPGPHPRGGAGTAGGGGTASARGAAERANEGRLQDRTRKQQMETTTGSEHARAPLDEVLDDARARHPSATAADRVRDAFADPPEHDDDMPTRDDLSDDERGRVHEAMRILAARDALNHPEASYGSHLESRMLWLRDMTRLAHRHPHLTPEQMASFVDYAVAIGGERDDDG